MMEEDISKWGQQGKEGHAIKEVGRAKLAGKAEGGTLFLETRVKCVKSGFTTAKKNLYVVYRPLQILCRLVLRTLTNVTGSAALNSI